MAKLKHSDLPKDKIRHKIVSYFILRKLGEILPLNMAKNLTYSLTTSKELLDKFGLGTFEKEDLKANEIGIKEAQDDIINKKPYRYKPSNKKLVKDLLRYLHLKD